MKIRKALFGDLPAIEEIYHDIHVAEEQGNVIIGWNRKIYPIASTAEQALKRSDLFVQEENGKIVGTSIINQQQVDVYRLAKWSQSVLDSEIMVLHTLVISPKEFGKGYGKSFIDFYENYAISNGCRYLRIDTNEKNVNARKFYKKLGFTEVGMFSCSFNGLKDVHIVLLEKFV